MPSEGWRERAVLRSVWRRAEARFALPYLCLDQVRQGFRGRAQVLQGQGVMTWEVRQGDALELQLMQSFHDQFPHQYSKLLHAPAVGLSQSTAQRGHIGKSAQPQKPLHHGIILIGLTLPQTPIPTAGNDGCRGVYPELSRRAQLILRLNRGAAICGELDPYGSSWTFTEQARREIGTPGMRR